MNRKKKSKKIIDSIDLHSGFQDDLTSDDQQGDAVLDSIFQNYYTPDIDTSDRPEDETFIEGMEADLQAIMTDFKTADVSMLDMSKAQSGVGGDYDYFVCVVFVSNAQKEAFMKASGWDQYGGTRYLNGIEMAKDMGIELPLASLSLEARPDKKLSRFVKKGD